MNSFSTFFKFDQDDENREETASGLNFQDDV